MRRAHHRARGHRAGHGGRGARLGRRLRAARRPLHAAPPWRSTPGAGRLAPTAVLGAPPLVDGALISLHAPAEQPGDHGQYGRFGQYGSPPADLATLHVVGGPDAGGVHLLQGGQARIGRSADADVPLDDPDVSRLHCAVAVGPDGRVTVTDLGSTNGTALSGRPVGAQPLPFPPGALLRIGESTLRLDPARPGGPAPLAASADTDGHLHVSPRADDGADGESAGGGWTYAEPGGPYEPAEPYAPGVRRGRRRPARQSRPARPGLPRAPAAWQPSAAPSAPRPSRPRRPGARSARGARGALF